MSLDENKALSKRLYEEVFGWGNLDAADEILTVDSVSHGPGAPGESHAAPARDAKDRRATISHAGQHAAIVAATVDLLARVAAARSSCV